jgi:hypothetical protein
MNYFSNQGVFDDLNGGKYKRKDRCVYLLIVDGRIFIFAERSDAVDFISVSFSGYKEVYSCQPKHGEYFLAVVVQNYYVDGEDGGESPALLLREGVTPSLWPSEEQALRLVKAHNLREYEIVVDLEFMYETKS